jgi:hypothetical protein
MRNQKPFGALYTQKSGKCEMRNQKLSLVWQGAYRGQEQGWKALNASCPSYLFLSTIRRTMP